MNKAYKKGLFIFRRDLRLEDNTGLIAASKQCATIIPCFIFDPRQIGKENTFASMNAMQFMVESLDDLSEQLKKQGGRLYLFYGIAEEVVKQLCTQESIDILFCNRDYTPFSINRDEAIKRVVHEEAAEFKCYGDLLLNEPEAIKTQTGKPYSIFTPFYKQASRLPVSPPQKLHKTTWYTKTINSSESSAFCKKIVPVRNKDLHVKGGTKSGKTLLRNLKRLKNYEKTRDFPAIATSNLSAHLKFGTISIRQARTAIEQKLGEHHPLIRQLYWRDFFTHVAYHSPYVFGQPYHEKYKNLPWSTSKKNFDAWCQGLTGFPIVDAGMRQLNITGFMHNRTRMIVGSFLTKDLHINWLWGEKYFAQQLVDYDPSVNNGNWQWCASTGCDSQPYFRIFNPWLQQKKFDPDCIYIKHWVPELKEIEPSIIHTWYKTKHSAIKGYPRPIVDHKKESATAKKMYKNV